MLTAYRGLPCPVLRCRFLRLQQEFSSEKQLIAEMREWLDCYALREQQVRCSSGPISDCSALPVVRANTTACASRQRPCPLQPIDHPCCCAACACLQLCLQGFTILNQGHGQLVATQAALIAANVELLCKDAKLATLWQLFNFIGFVLTVQAHQRLQTAQNLQHQLDNQADQLRDARVRGGFCRSHRHCLLSMRSTNRRARWLPRDLHSPCLVFAVAVFLVQAAQQVAEDAQRAAEAAKEAAEVRAMMTGVELTCVKDRLAEVGFRKAGLPVCMQLCLGCMGLLRGVHSRLRLLCCVTVWCLQVERRSSSSGSSSASSFGMSQQSSSRNISDDMSWLFASGGSRPWQQQQAPAAAGAVGAANDSSGACAVSASVEMS